MQSDCSLLSGDSGGPLFDMSGRVIGIHSRISESAEANFHVPISSFFESWERLARGDTWGAPGLPRSVYIGASGLDAPQGCRLDRIDENGPAFKAGLKVGDIVIRINDQPVTGYEDFLQSVATIGPGKEMTMLVKRNREELSVRVTAEARGRRGRGAFPRP
jgi:serine protease Do